MAEEMKRRSIFQFFRPRALVQSGEKEIIVVLFVELLDWDISLMG
jgi:hypothetical protein